MLCPSLDTFWPLIVIHMIVCSFCSPGLWSSMFAPVTFLIALANQQHRGGSSLRPTIQRAAIHHGGEAMFAGGWSNWLSCILGQGVEKKELWCSAGFLLSRQSRPSVRGMTLPFREGLPIELTYSRHSPKGMLRGLFPATWKKILSSWQPILTITMVP